MQCKVSSRGELHTSQRAGKIRSNCNSVDNLATPKVRSLEQVFRNTLYQTNCCNNQQNEKSKNDKYNYKSENYCERYNNGNSDHCGNYNIDPAANRSRIIRQEFNGEDFGRRDCRNYECCHYPERVRHYEERNIENPSEHYVNEKDFRVCYSRVNRDHEYKERYDEIREKGPRERREYCDKYYDGKDNFYGNKKFNSNYPRHQYESNFHKEHASRRNLDSRLERNSVVSRDDFYKERDRYSERERDSGLSLADGDTSVISAKSNYLRSVKVCIRF